MNEEVSMNVEGAILVDMSLLYEKVKSVQGLETI